MKQVVFECLKCKCKSCEVSEVTASGNLSKFFDVQNHKFQVATCQECGFSEFYKVKTSGLDNFIDFICS